MTLELVLSEKQVLPEYRRRQRRHWRQKDESEISYGGLVGAGRTAALHMHIQKEWPEGVRAMLREGQDE